MKQYLELMGSGQEILDASFNNIAGGIDLDVPSVVVFNQLGFERNDIVGFNLPEGYEDAEIDMKMLR